MTDDVKAKDSGLTFVELLIIVVIVGILAAIAVLIFTDQGPTDRDLVRACSDRGGEPHYTNSFLGGFDYLGCTEAS